MGNGVRTRDGLPFNFEDGLKVKDVDISGIQGGTVLGIKALPTDTAATKLQDWINLITAQLADILANGVGGNSETAADRSLLDNSNFIANTKFVQALVAQTILNLVGNAPNNLNTFAEVAAAIGNDPYFSSTVQGLIDGKASIEDVRGTLATFSIAGTNLNAISATFLPTIGQLSDGLLLRVRAYGANTSTTPTFSPDSGNIPFKTIVKGANTELSIGDIAGAGYWMLLQYDAAIDKWILLNPAFALNVKMATNAEAIDGLESNKSISPSSLKAALEALIGAAPAQLNTLKEFADALANDPNFAATMTAALAAKAPLDSAALTGSPTAPTALTGNNSTRIATTAFVAAAIVASVVDATTLVKGVTRLSTISEALDGTSEAVAVTPKGMRAYVESAISSAFTPPNSPTLSGNSTSVVGTNYALNMSATVTQVGATISSFDVSVNGGAAVTVPATSGAATYNWTTTGTIGSTANFSVTAKDSNNKVSGVALFSITLTTITVNTPSITAPTNNATNVAVNPSFTTSAYATTGGSDPHLSSSWEIRTAAAGAGTLVISSATSTTNKTTWTPSVTLSPSTVYYVRVRHESTNYGNSAYSENSFTTLAAATPSITAPTAGATGVSITPTITTAAFSGINGSDVHSTSDWEIRTAANGGGTLVASSTASATNKVSWTVPAATLTTNTTYYVRVRHNGSVSGASAWTERSFTTGRVNAPTITAPASGATGITLTPTITTSAFSTVGTDTHASSSWEVRTAAGGGGTALVSSLNDTTNKVSYTVNGGILAASTTYYIRVRHTGTIFGATAWVESSFTTGSASVPTISSPAPSSTGVALSPSFTSSAYSAGDTHGSSDWELRTAAGGAGTLLASVTASTTNKTTWTPSVTLSQNTTYYVRVRYFGSTFGYSAWGEASFTTGYVSAPSFTSPTNGETNRAQVSTASLAAFASNGVVTHSSTDWQVRTAAGGGGTVLFSATADTVNKTSISLPASANPNGGSTYYIRARFNTSSMGTTNWTEVSYTTGLVATPSIQAPAPGATNVSTTPTYTSSGFNASAAQTHVSSDWELRTAANGGGTLLASLTASTTSKTSWTPSVTLSNSTTYYFRVRHTGNTFGTSSWAEGSFTTAAQLTVPSVTGSGFIPKGGTHLINMSAVPVAPATAISSFFLTIPGVISALEVPVQSNNQASYTMSAAQTNGMTLANTVGITATYRDNAAANSGASTAYNATVGQVNTAVITAPTNGATGISTTPTLATQAFASTNSLDTHSSTSWEIRTAASGGGTLVWSSATDTVNKTSITVPSATLSNNTTYYLRAKHHGSAFAGSELWAEVSFTTLAAAFVTTPSLTSPTAAQTGYKGPLTSSAFAVTNGTDTHLSSDWQIASDSGFVTVVASVSASTTNKTSWAPTGLVGGTVYYARVRHRGNTYGASSWSATVSFTWIATNKPTISTPTAGATGVSTTPTLTSSAFSSTGTDTHSTTQWQIGTSGAFTTIVTSSSSGNLTSWSPAGLAASTTYYARVRYTGATGQVSAWSDTVNFTTSSPSGVSWAEINFGGGGMLDATFGNGLYLTCGYTTAGSLAAGSLWTSTDATTWTQRTLPSAGFQTSVLYNGTIYITAGYSDSGSDSSGYIATSTNGITWTQRTFPAGGIWGIEWDGAQFITTGFGSAGGAEGGYVCTSPDGITWTARGVQGPPSSGWGRGLTYSSSLDLIVMCGEQSGSDPTYPEGGWISTSPDGITWTQRFATPGMIDQVSWSPTLGLFVAVGHGGTGSAAYAGSTAQTPGVWWSTNGITWTAGTISGAGAGAMIDVVWTGSQFVAVGFSSTGANTAGSIMTSSDGKAWTVRSVSVGRLRGVGGGTGGSKIVAAGYSTAGSTAAGRVYTS